MANLRYITRLTKAFLIRFKALLLLGTVFGILLFFFFSYISPKFLGKKVQKIGITGSFNINNLPDEVLSLIGEGLTSLDESGSPQPALASSWSTTDGGKTWTFVLDDEAVWQDGEVVTSDSISYNFSDVVISRPDDKTIVFELKDPFSPFPTVVSRPVFKKGLLSTGEWEVKKASVLSGNLVQSLNLKDEKGNRKIYKFYPTEERTKLAFKLGEVDEVHNLFNPAPFDNWQTVLIERKIEEGQVVAIFFNTQDQLLGDKTFRQALDYAINKESLGLARAISPLNPNSWAYNAQVKAYPYSKEKAKEFLGEAGDELEIKLATSPVLLSIAEEIEKYWEDVGVNTTVQVSSSIPEDYQAYLAILDIPKDPDQYSLWHSTQTVTNISNFSNPRIDKLLEDGRTNVDQGERKKTFLDFQRFMVEELPAAFLYHPISYSVIRK